MNPDVDAWFEKRHPPQDETMRLVRDVILRADRRVEETIKWQTPTFTYKGNIASFNPAKNFVSLLFHTGAEIPGKHPDLEGDSRLTRVMRFDGPADVRAKRKGLQALVRAWCDWKDQ
jgi:hypothetical protein